MYVTNVIYKLIKVKYIPVLLANKTVYSNCSN